MGNEFSVKSMKSRIMNSLIVNTVRTHSSIGARSAIKAINDVIDAKRAADLRAAPLPELEEKKLKTVPDPVKLVDPVRWWEKLEERDIEFPIWT